MDFFKRKKTTEQMNKETAQKFINVKDVQNGFYYTNDNLVIGYYEIEPISINLLSKREKRTLTSNLAAEFSPEKNKFKILAISKPVDIAEILDEYSQLKRTGDEAQKEILRQEMLALNDFALSGEIVERHFYYVYWETANIKNVEKEMLTRGKILEERFEAAQIRVKKLKNDEVIRLVNFFNNPTEGLSDIENNINPTMPSIEEI